MGFMKRSILAVGQGAFFTECFNDEFRVVYDCGSASGSSVIDCRIKQEFEKHTKIDLLFISHLHKDHISGLELLLKYCDVKKIVLPCITDAEKINLKLYNLVNLDKHEKDLYSFIINFIDNPLNAVKNCKSDAEIIQVLAYENDERKDISENKSLISKQGVQYISSGDKIETDTQIDWIYVPYNISYDCGENTVADEIIQQKIFGNITKEELYSLPAEEFIKLQSDKKRFAKLENIYKNMSGNLNDNSMIVYSGPEKLDTSYINKCIYGRYICYPYLDEFYYKVAALYTGDYNAKKHLDKLCNALNKKLYIHKDIIGIIQIPHHGSKNNFNSKLINNSVFYFINAGNTNKYGHPHTDVINQILLNNVYFKIVTEDVNSTLRFIYDY